MEPLRRMVRTETQEAGVPAEASGLSATQFPGQEQFARMGAFLMAVAVESPSIRRIRMGLLEAFKPEELEETQTAGRARFIGVNQRPTMGT